MNKCFGMEKIDDEYREDFSRRLNALFDDEEWEGAKILLEQESAKFPEEYFLLTSLSKVCFNLQLFEESLKYASKAIEIEPNDTLVVYDYGCALAAVGRYKEAIVQWDNIIAKDINEVAYGDYGEGLRWAKSIINDSRYRKAMCLIEIGDIEKAKQLIVSHLSNRERGIYSDFTKKQVLTRQKSLNS